MRNVYLVECVDLHYVCEVCSSVKTARLVKRWYHEIVGKGKHVYRITSRPLLDSNFNFVYDVPKR